MDTKDASTERLIETAVAVVAAVASTAAAVVSLASTGDSSLSHRKCLWTHFCFTYTHIFSFHLPYLVIEEWLTLSLSKINQIRLPTLCVSSFFLLFCSSSPSISSLPQLINEIIESRGDSRPVVACLCLCPWSGRFSLRWQYFFPLSNSLLV